MWSEDAYAASKYPFISRRQKIWTTRFMTRSSDSATAGAVLGCTSQRRLLRGLGTFPVVYLSAVLIISPTGFILPLGALSPHSFLLGVTAIWAIPWDVVCAFDTTTWDVVAFSFDTKNVGIVVIVWNCFQGRGWPSLAFLFR